MKVGVVRNQREFCVGDCQCSGSTALGLKYASVYEAVPGIASEGLLCCLSSFYYFCGSYMTGSDAACIQFSVLIAARQVAARSVLHWQCGTLVSIARAFHPQWIRSNQVSSPRDAILSAVRRPQRVNATG